MTDFIDEIKEDLEREKYAKLWNEYSTLILFGMIAILAGTGVGLWWNDSTMKKQQVIGDQFYQATIGESRDNKKSLEILGDIVQQREKGFSGLAGLKEASILINQGQIDKAISLYNDIASSRKNDTAVRDLASLLAEELRIGNGKADKNDDDTLKRLAAKDGIWRYLAMEMQGLRALGQNNTQQAKDIFTSLTKESLAPAGVRNRAEQMLAIIEEKK